MSRTRRIYNSYRRFGRYFPKESYIINRKNEEGVFIPILPKKFDVSVEFKNKIFESGYYIRWYPFAMVCMGNCHYCKRTKQSRRITQRKHTKKRDLIKFSA